MSLEGDLESPDLTAFEIGAERAIAQGDLAVIVDLSGVAFVGSNVVNAMFRICRKLRPHGGAMAMICTDQQALRVIQVTGLDQVVALCSNLDDAVHAVAPHRTGFH